MEAIQELHQRYQLFVLVEPSYRRRTVPCDGCVSRSNGADWLPRKSGRVVEETILEELKANGKESSVK